MRTCESNNIGYEVYHSTVDRADHQNTVIVIMVVYLIPPVVELLDEVSQRLFICPLGLMVNMIQKQPSNLGWMPRDQLGGNFIIALIIVNIVSHKGGKLGLDALLTH